MISIRHAIAQNKPLVWGLNNLNTIIFKPADNLSGACGNGYDHEAKITEMAD